MDKHTLQLVSVELRKTKKFLDDKAELGIMETGKSDLLLNGCSIGVGLCLKKLTQMLEELEEPNER